jgi:4-hydroxy-tetrahydrodipicolinate synthase
MGYIDIKLQFGLSCALALPFHSDSSIDFLRLSQHARRSLDAGCSSVTVFGTTGEGASVSMSEREQILGALLAAGIALRDHVLGGVSAAAVGDAVEQARILIDRDCRGVLLAPPFYFKHVTDEGLYRWFSQVFEKIGKRARDVFLYHIPSVTEAPLSIELIGRLKTAFPQVVVGVKDSGGDWTYTESLLRAHSDLIVLIGDERHLAAGVRRGAKGAISGMANVCPAELLLLVKHGENDSRIVDLVSEVLKYPVTPAVKALLARRMNDEGWLNVRPPLMRISSQHTNELASAYDRIFSQQAAGVNIDFCGQNEKNQNQVYGTDDIRCREK